MWPLPSAGSPLLATVGAKTMSARNRRPVSCDRSGWERPRDSTSGALKTVRNRLGSTSITRIPNGATSPASASDQPSECELARRIRSNAGESDSRPPWLLICTIVPDPRARIAGRTARTSAAGTSTWRFERRSQIGIADFFGCADDADGRRCSPERRCDRTAAAWRPRRHRSGSPVAASEYSVANAGSCRADEVQDCLRTATAADDHRRRDRVRARRWRCQIRTWLAVMIQVSDVMDADAKPSSALERKAGFRRGQSRRNATDTRRNRRAAQATGLSRQPATADGEDRAVDVARRGGGDERHHVGDLFGLGGAPQCCSAAKALDEV